MSRTLADFPGDLLPLLPLIYIAWADGALSAGEIALIRERVREVTAAGPDALARLDPWLDPEQPLTSSELNVLRREIRRLVDERASDLAEPGSGDDERGSRDGERSETHAIRPDPARSLVSIGIEMAGGDGQEWASPEGIRTLEAVEEVLGVLGGEAMRELLAPGGAPSRPPGPEELPPRFGLDEMSRYLDGRYRELRREILALLEEDDFHFPEPMALDDFRDRVLRALELLAARGYGALGYPADHGGRGDVGASLAVFETLAFGDLSLLVKFGVQFGLFGGSVLQLGTERHHGKYLPAIGTLELPGSFAMTETGHGSNVREIETRAVYDAASEEFVIRTPHAGARKDWIGNAARHGRMATVFAQLEVAGEEQGVHAFLVPLRDGRGRTHSGIQIEDRGRKIGLNGVDNGTIRFDDVRVPRENLLNRFADVTPEGDYVSPIASSGKRFFTMLGTLVAGRISIAAASVSAAKTGLTIAVRYSARRRQFGPPGLPEVPILDYLTQQRLLLPRLATTYGLHFAVRQLSDAYVQRQRKGQGRTPGDGDRREVDQLELDRKELDQRELEGRAAGLKAYASRHTVETLQACREACGGEGYLAANRLGNLKADTDVFTTFEGANVVLLQLLAKGLLSHYGEEMGDLKFWGMVRHLAERAGDRVTILNPIAGRKADEAHLRDPEFHVAALRFREERLLHSAARRLKARIDAGEESFRAMNECQDHLVALSLAHLERVILEGFQEGALNAPTPGVSEVLQQLASLFALTRMEDHAGWYLESGYMEGGKTRAIRALVNRVCGEVREQAVWLVDAFGIPDDVLRAPAASPAPD